MNSDKIAHEGRIVAIDPQLTTVEIISESACSACHAKACALWVNRKRKRLRSLRLSVTGRWDRK